MTTHVIYKKTPGHIWFIRKPLSSCPKKKVAVGALIFMPLEPGITKAPAASSRAVREGTCRAAGQSGQHTDSLLGVPQFLLTARPWVATEAPSGSGGGGGPSRLCSFGGELGCCVSRWMALLIRTSHCRCPGSISAPFAKISSAQFYSLLRCGSKQMRL